MSEVRRAGVVLGMVFLVVAFARQVVSSDPPKRLDPVAWGSDHVGKTIPRYMTGDECLFCHRKDVGPTWSDNRHNRTLRLADADSPAMQMLVQFPPLKAFADEVVYVLGEQRQQRFLKPSKAYGKLELLSVAWTPNDGKFIHTTNPHWDTKKFADSCVGCHATAVDAKDRAFSALSLDCYTCHGDVPFEHTKTPSLVHLAKKRDDSAKVVTSICAQCHVRTGKSKSTGLPYPNTFVAGDNLFRDFVVDLTPAQIERQNPADAHVLANVRDVVLLGKEDVTCLSCHDVHGQSSKKHHRIANSEYCLHCHHADGPKRVRKTYTVHSKTCGY